ncbi:MAG TPA: prepilin-type N-terminal cleavage/methylation domain-containing protein [Sedimentisphaerales bacterium]|nr:prepilin-type N-terminal cleavage/methylation domain-containing protein [Sedimentisphaerales bacterium]
MHKRRTRGFTLIELLVVIAIIALLMSILMPALQRVKLQAKSVACISKLKQWGLFFSMYAEDNDSRFMLGFSNRPTANRWVYALRDYYKWDDEFTCCPNATKPWVDEYGVNSNAEGSEVGVTMAWGYTRDDHWYWQGEPAQMKGSYGINGWVVNPDPGEEPHPERGTPDFFWRGPSVAGAGYVPLFMEGMRYNGMPLHNDTPPTVSGEDWNDYAQMGRFCLDRHDGFAGCLLMDFSARKVGLKELWTLKWHREYKQAGPYTIGGGVQPTDWPDWMRKFKDY